MTRSTYQLSDFLVICQSPVTESRSRLEFGNHGREFVLVDALARLAGAPGARHGDGLALILLVSMGGNVALEEGTEEEAKVSLIRHEVPLFKGGRVVATKSSC